MYNDTGLPLINPDTIVLSSVHFFLANHMASDTSHVTDYPTTFFLSHILVLQ